MTKEEFLSDPLRYFQSEGAERFPLDWIQAAWANIQVQEAALFAFSRSVSKVGNLSLADDWVQVLGPILSAVQVVTLYGNVRDATERSESEWRADFERAFPQSHCLLPSIDKQRELYNRTVALFITIYWGESERVQRRIDDLLQADIRLDDAVLSSDDFARFPEGQDCLHALESIGQTGKRTFTPLSLARLLQHEAIVRMLVSAGATY
jgi:hypothetical protein